MIYKKNINPRAKSSPAVLSPNAASKANVVHVLDSKRSLAINIMLKQFKTGGNEIIEALQNGTSIPLEKLKGLQRVLPTDEEVFFFYVFSCIWNGVIRTEDWWWYNVSHFVYLDEDHKETRRRLGDSRNGRIVLFGPRQYIQLSVTNKTHDRGMYDLCLWSKMRLQFRV